MEFHALINWTILGNPGVTHSVPTAFVLGNPRVIHSIPTAFMMIAVGIWNGSRLGY